MAGMVRFRYVQPPILVRISRSNFCQTWQKFPNPFLSVLALMDYASFGFFKGCQILLHILPWTGAVFTCWCLSYLAKMSTIFILLHISLHSGFWFSHYACQIWQKLTTQFCQFWHSSATHIGINSGNFYMLMFAIFGKNVRYFYTSIYQLT